MLVLNAEHVRRLLPLPDAIATMREAMTLHGAGSVYQPLRTAVEPPSVPGLFMFKPAHLGPPFSALGFKALTIFPENPTSGHEAIQAFVALLDTRTGIVMAILEGSTLTEIRTAAVSAVATDLLAQSDAGTLAIIGSGVQARSHLLALAEVRTLHHVRVWSRKDDSARDFAKWATTHDIEVLPVDSVAAATDGADIVCTVTASSLPLLDADWLTRGVHINAVGSYQPNTRELHSNVIQQADVLVVDSRESALVEAGDILIPMNAGAVPGTLELTELGELLNGAPGRTSDDECTVFKSLGLAIQDIAAAAFIYDRAKSVGIGTEIPFP
jgi:ornithine cyclodeaminase